MNTPRIPGSGEVSRRIERVRVPLDVALDGTGQNGPASGVLQFRDEMRVLRARVTAGVAAGDVLIVPGKGSQNGSGKADFAAVSDGYDPLDFPLMRFAVPFRDVMVYSRTALASGVLTLTAAPLGIDGEVFERDVLATTTISAANVTVVAPLGSATLATRGVKTEAFTRAMKDPPIRTTLAATSTSQTLKAALATRIGGYVTNPGSKTAYVRFDASAAVTLADSPVYPGGYLDIPEAAGAVYRGEIRAVCDAGDTTTLVLVEFEEP